MSRVASAFRPYARMGWGGKAASHFRGLVSSPDEPQGQIGTPIFRGELAHNTPVLTGVTRDSAGNPVGNCALDLYITHVDVIAQQGASDASGNFSFVNPGSGPFYIVAYKAGSPDIAGTTVNTLVAV